MTDEIINLKNKLCEIECIVFKKMNSYKKIKNIKEILNLKESDLCEK